MIDSVNVCENALLFGFRYAIDQTTWAGEIIVREILVNWVSLSDEFKLQIVRDINGKKNFCTAQLHSCNAYIKAINELWLEKSFPIWEAILIKADKEKENDR